MDEPETPPVKRIRLTGDRFDGGRLPIDSLVELERYQNAVRAMAAHEWRRDHPGEVLPEGFDDSVSLAIREIRDGSAEILLAFEQHVVYETYQAQAQDAVDATIEAAYAGADLPELPNGVAEEVRESLAQIGTTLQDGQSIEIYSRGDLTPPVRITISTRPAAAERLILTDFLSEPVPTSGGGVTRQETSIVARVTVVDAENKKYELRSEEFGSIHGRYRDNPALLEDLRALVDSSSAGPLTRIYGELRYRDGKPWSFWTTSRIERVEFDDTPWGHTLTDFVSLPTGWADGHGEQVSSVALEATQMLFRQLGGASAAPAMAPTEEGGVLLEWIAEGGLRSVEVLPDGRFELFSMKPTEQRGHFTETENVAEAARFVGEADA